MWKFGIVLCIVLFASETSAVYDSNYTIKSYERKINYIIQKYTNDYYNTGNRSTTIYDGALNKTVEFRQEKIENMQFDLRLKEQKFNQLIAATPNGNILNCTRLIGNLRNLSKIATETIDSCIGKQSELGDKALEDVLLKVIAGLKDLKNFTESAAACQTENTNTGNRSIVSCLKTVKRRLCFARKPTFVREMNQLRLWDKRLTTELFYCAANSLFAYKINSNALINETMACLRQNQNVRP